MSNTKSYFDGVYEKVYRDLLRYAVIHLEQPADAEDVLQTVFTAFYRRIVRFGHFDILTPKAFLMRMLQREISRWNEQRTKEGNVFSLEEETEYADQETGIEELVADRSMAETVLETAKTLTADSYRVFVLYYGYGLSTAQIAGELGIGREAVKTRLFRARNAIRKQLLAEGNER